MGSAQPIEEFMQYTDKQGNTYVASPPQDSSLEPWFNDMVERYDLYQLTQMFPYVTLIVDPDTRMLKPWTTCSYNAKVTNAFHILLAQAKDSQMGEYGLENLEQCFSDVSDEPRNINAPAPEKIIMTDKDGYQINYNNLPNYVIIEPLRNWHPNKDPYGNYKRSNYHYYDYPYTPYPGGFVPINNYSYLPSYQTFTMYPF